FHTPTPITAPLGSIPVSTRSSRTPICSKHAGNNGLPGQGARGDPRQQRSVLPRCGFGCLGESFHQATQARPKISASQQPLLRPTATKKIQYPPLNSGSTKKLEAGGLMLDALAAERARNARYHKPRILTK